MYKRIGITLAVFLVVLLSYAPALAGEESCVDPSAFLEHSKLTIYNPGTNAQITITNLSGECYASIGLASYRRLNHPLGDYLELYQFTATTISPGYTINLDVPIPACATEVVAFWGPVITQSGFITYGNRLIDSTHTTDRPHCDWPCSLCLPVVLSDTP